MAKLDPQPSVPPESTLMFQEAAETASRVESSLALNREPAAEIAAQLRAYQPQWVITCARGSSDHAATYAKYLIETQLGIVTASAAPSVASVYQRSPKLGSVLFIAISQSGKSPDLIANLEWAKAAGARTLAVVNQEDSPLARAADWVLPVRAGPECSVAATKSYIGSLAVLLQLVAHWSQDEALKSGVNKLPGQLIAAWQQDWTSGVKLLKEATNLFVVGRGLGLGIAQEAALKLKETCGLHAEAFSSAEVKHGPMALVGKGFPVLMLTQPDETRESMLRLAEEFHGRGARLLMADDDAPGEPLPTVPGALAVSAPLLAIQSFYRMTNSLALARGLHPDKPPHLQKVTETL